MPKNNTKPYVRWCDRKRNKPKLEVPPTFFRVAGSLPNTSICQLCGKEFNRVGKFCNRSCHNKSNSISIREWEQAIAAHMEADGWQIFRPMSCCDRLGVKDGQLFFLEFKPKENPQLRTYQKIVQKLVPHMYRVVVGKWGTPENAKILHTKGSFKQINFRRSKKNRDVTSEYKGVNWDKKMKLWRARLMVNGQRLSLGHFPDEKTAAEAYDKALRLYFGPIAHVNFRTE
jgi:hypothetical protein